MRQFTSAGESFRSNQKKEKFLPQTFNAEDKKRNSNATQFEEVPMTGE